LSRTWIFNLADIQRLLATIY